MDARFRGHDSRFVIPAKAGIRLFKIEIGFRFRGNDD
jgi:hypothetical protein